MSGARDMNQPSNMTALLPEERANAVNLLAHPVAGAAAMSALGVAFASHAFGVWMGAFAGAVETSRRLVQASLGEDHESGENLPAPKVPAAKARARARTVIERAQSFARDVSDAAAEASGGGAKGIEGAAGSSAVSRQAATAPGDLMPEDFRQPTAMNRPAMADDLKAISGIGPKLEQVLNGLGIWSYRQIAGWSAEEIAWVDDYLGFKGRIGRDDWLGQAAALTLAAKGR